MGVRPETMHGARIVFTGIALLCLACASPHDDRLDPRQVMEGEFDGAPRWVTQSCASYWDEEPAPLCGVGSVKGSRNLSLMRTTAIGRGRTEIARSLDTRVKAMLKDYASTTTGGAEFGRAANDEQHIVDVSKQVTEVSLAGSEHIDSWVSSNGTYYALVGLDAERFTTSVSRMEQLSESLRAAIVERANEAFSDLDDDLGSER